MCSATMNSKLRQFIDTAIKQLGPRSFPHEPRVIRFASVNFQLY
jgi:hypothetical protein